MTLIRPSQKSIKVGSCELPQSYVQVATHKARPVQNSPHSSKGAGAVHYWSSSAGVWHCPLLT